MLFTDVTNAIINTLNMKRERIQCRGSVHECNDPDEMRFVNQFMTKWGTIMQHLSVPAKHRTRMCLLIHIHRATVWGYCSCSVLHWWSICHPLPSKVYPLIPWRLNSRYVVTAFPSQYRWGWRGCVWDSLRRRNTMNECILLGWIMLAIEKRLLHLNTSHSFWKEDN